MSKKFTSQDIIKKRVDTVNQLEKILKEFKGKNLDADLFKAATDKVKAQFKGDMSEFLVIEHMFGRL